MRIIREFQTAKAVLQRSPFEFGELSIEIGQMIKRIFGEELTPEEAVGRIIAEVRTRGDAALLDYTKRIDGVALTSLETTREEINEAYGKVDKELISSLNIAATRVRSFHQVQLRHSFREFSEAGLGQIVRPLERVGIYVPGGTACYPSTVLMSVIPARMAGVKEVIVTTPPGNGEKGEIPPATLVAADIAKVDRVFKVGGAQAIAALAFGTQSIPKVDKLCGPGGVFVILAKKMVFGVVDIDGLAGPTETVLLADDSASAALCAADLLAQAEHDVLASAILITTSSRLAQEVSEEVTRQLKGLERADIARQSVEERGKIIMVADMDQAIELVNLYAPEHLCLMVRHASSYMDKIRHAGGIFIGESSPEALGDYVAGPSHVMPTGGSARFSSPLGVGDFLKLTSIVSLTRQDLEALGSVAATIARAEGFTAHAHALEARLKKGRKR
ncbi:MAG: histidinol dehydrogenase [Dehalococcoidia bacterium DG_18]|nr:MAG: histidinol dehydrogenase [Dehalococcoidia bacterium DG_18]